MWMLHIDQHNESSEYRVSEMTYGKGRINKFGYNWGGW